MMYWFQDKLLLEGLQGLAQHWILCVFIFGWENKNKQQLLCFFWTNPNLESIVSHTKENNLMFKMEQVKLKTHTGNNKVMFSLNNSS